MLRLEEMRTRSGVRPTQQEMFIMIRATGRCEFSCENPFELLGIYISRFGMSIQTKGAVQFEPPLMDVASKMPLLISLFLPTQKAELSSRKNTRTFQKSPDKIMQCFRSSRGDGNFCQIGHRLNFKPIFQHN